MVDMLHNFIGIRSFIISEFFFGIKETRVSRHIRKSVMTIKF